MEFCLRERSDESALRSQFRQNSGVSIPALLPHDQALTLHDWLLGEPSWKEIFRAEEQVYEMPADEFANLTVDQRSKLDELVHVSARDALQYRYRSIRVADPKSARAEIASPLHEFAEFLVSDPVIDFLRRVTGLTEVRFLDAQATAFGPGHFLTTHDDAVEGKDRLAAYVYSLTPKWRADLGGLLLFEDEDEVEGFVPQFNALRIFSVPRQHHVTLVVPWATDPRLSITGWLRSCDQPIS